MSLPRLLSLSPYKMNLLVRFIVDCGNDNDSAAMIASNIIATDRLEAYTIIIWAEYRIAWSLIKCGGRYEGNLLFTLPEYGDLLFSLETAIFHLLNPYIKYWRK